jgi:hypothetical protein
MNGELPSQLSARLIPRNIASPRDLIENMPPVPLTLMEITDQTLCVPSSFGFFSESEFFLYTRTQVSLALSFSD